MQIDTCSQPQALLSIKYMETVRRAYLFVQVTCSRGGTCLSAAAGGATAAGSAPAEAAASSAVGTGAAADAPNKPPEIQLVDIVGSSPVVHVRSGQDYRVCTDGVPPTVDSPCEPGATAFDPDGLAAAAGSNGSTALNLTSRVVVCPPTKCISSGCSPSELQRHYFVNKGLKGCGIDTTAPEGTEFKVRTMFQSGIRIVLWHVGTASY